MKLYTGNGDSGKSLSPQGQIDKSDVYFELLGGIDEVSAQIGYLATILDNFPDKKVQLSEILKDLHAISTDLAKFAPKELFDFRRIKLLENWIDEMMKTLPPLQQFVLPLGHKTSSYTHVVRTTTRRVERVFFKATNSYKINSDIGVYLNRLSDYFFALARFINHQYGVEDVI